MRLREQQHNHLMRPQAVMPGQMGQINMRRNGVVPPNLQKAVLQNNTTGLYVLALFPPFGVIWCLFVFAGPSSKWRSSRRIR